MKTTNEITSPETGIKGIFVESESCGNACDDGACCFGPETGHGNCHFPCCKNERPDGKNGYFKSL